MVTFGEMHRPDSDGNPPFFRMQSCGNLNDDLPAQTQPQEVRNHETGSPLASTDEYKQNVRETLMKTSRCEPPAGNH